MSDHPVELSVVIAVLDAGSLLGDQLRALASQVGAPPFEVILADNGSSDGSPERARAFADRLMLRVVDGSARRGQTFARNVGASIARADRLIFLDQDDVVDAGYLAAMAAALVDHELVGARMDAVRLNPGRRAEARSLAQTTGLPAEPVVWAYGCTLGVRRSVWERVGGFDVELYTSAEDLDFCLRAATAGVVAQFVPDAILHYRFPASARKLMRQGRRYGIGQVLVERKHGIDGLAFGPWLRMTIGSAWRLASSDPARRAQGAFLVGRRWGWLEGRLRAGRATSTNWRH